MNKKKVVLLSIDILIASICIIYYVISLIVSGGASILYVWLVLGVGIILKDMWIIFKDRLVNVDNSLSLKNLKYVDRLLVIINIVEVIFFSGFLVFSIFVISDMSSYTDEECDYIIILGASVNGTEPSDILKARIEVAYEYLLKHENTKAIGTGGIGDGEDISEGKCIVNELEKMGIDSSRLLYEDKSTTTVENMKYALEKADNPNKIALVTSEFHVFRAKLILSNYTDARVYGIGSGNGGILTLHYILREYIVYMVDVVLGNYVL